MGAWGTALFSDDVACDIRDHYRELLEDGVEDSVAARQTLEKYDQYVADADGVAIIALAVTQSKVGRLEPGVRDRALAAIAAGADLAVWQQDNPKLVSKRREVLERARAQLTGPQPARKRMRPPRRDRSNLSAGDVLALALPRRLVLMRVVRVHAHRRGESPIIEELEFDGDEIPAPDVLEQLPPRVKDPVAFAHPLASDTRFVGFVNQRIDWRQAGFQKVATMASRPGDEQAPVPLTGVSWGELAERYRRRAVL